MTKIDSNQELMKRELADHYEVVTEAIQTELRKVGYPEPYELLKNLSRGKAFTEESKHELVKALRGKVPEESLKKIE